MLLCRLFCILRIGDLRNSPIYSPPSLNNLSLFAELAIFGLFTIYHCFAMEARNRKIEDWYGKIVRGEIKLPRFQRWEAWERGRICSLMHTISQDLPLGITLVLEVGAEERFLSRYIATAPEEQTRVLEHLLDGQQRLTALWRLLHNNYQTETYYIFCPELSSISEIESQEQVAYYRSRYYKKDQCYPLWCDSPEECLKRGLIPTQLLRPEDIHGEISSWIDAATASRRPIEPNLLEDFFNWKKSVSDKINGLRSTIKNYNLPYLSLPTSTSKNTALEVFLNMNTNSKPLSAYDIIVAEIEQVKNQSLHDLQKALGTKYPDIGYYEELSSLILNTSALLQEQLPNKQGAWDMDKVRMVDNWTTMENGLVQMAKFLHSQGIYDHKRLPTNAVLAVIAALYPHIPARGDERGAYETILKQYLWSAFFTNRYENSAATNAYADYLALKRVIVNAHKEDGAPYTTHDVPVFNRDKFPIADADELLSAGWPKKETIRGRAILAVSCLLGSCDFATGERLSRSNIVKRQYHHVFPAALLSEAQHEGNLALNCALISDSTNLTIGRKDPLQYLKDRYAWASEHIVNERLHSHLIPIQELANGGYEHLDDATERCAKIRSDAEIFFRKRAEYFAKAAAILVEGRSISPSEIMSM